MTPPPLHGRESGLGVLNRILTELPFTDFELRSQMLLRHLLPTLIGSPRAGGLGEAPGGASNSSPHSRVTNRPFHAIEIDGFERHENNPRQLARDALKDQICATYGIPLERLPTTGSGEEERIRRRLDLELHGAPPPPPEVVGADS